MKKLLYLAVLLVFSACENEVELDIPRSPQQLVVSGILIPTQDIEVNVSLSEYVMDTTETIISDAEVNLYCENQLVTQLQHTVNGKYTQLDLKPMVGKVYSISVSVNGFATALAQTTVPYPISQDSIIITQDIDASKNGLDLSTLDLYFNKNSEDENYYSYACSGMTLDTIYSHYTDYLTGDTITTANQGFLTNFECYHPAILKEGNEDTRFFSDKDIDSEQINLKVFCTLSDFSLPRDTTFTFKIESQITALSEEYYLFQKSYQNLNDKQDQILGDNSLPSLYSNVTNALGCFSAITPSNNIIQNIEIRIKRWGE